MLSGAMEVGLLDARRRQGGAGSESRVRVVTPLAAGEATHLQRTGRPPELYGMRQYTRFPPRISNAPLLP